MVPILLQTGTPNLSQRIRFLLCWTLDVFLKVDSDAPWQPWFIVIHPASHGHLVGRMSDGKSKPIDCTYSKYLGIQTWPESNRSQPALYRQVFFLRWKADQPGRQPTLWLLSAQSQSISLLICLGTLWETSPSLRKALQMIAALSVTGFSDLGKPIKHAMLTGVIASCEVLDKQGLMNMRVDCPMWYQNSVPKIKKKCAHCKKLEAKEIQSHCYMSDFVLFFPFFAHQNLQWFTC